MKKLFALASFMLLASATISRPVSTETVVVGGTLLSLIAYCTYRDIKRTNAQAKTQTRESDDSASSAGKSLKQALAYTGIVVGLLSIYYAYTYLPSAS